MNEEVELKVDRDEWRERCMKARRHKDQWKTLAMKYREVLSGVESEDVRELLEERLPSE